MNAVRCARRFERGDGFAMVELSRMVVGTVQDERHPRAGARLELIAHSAPSRGRRSAFGRQMRAELVTTPGQMIEKRGLAIRRDPAHGVARRPSPSAVATPED